MQDDKLIFKWVPLTEPTTTRKPIVRKVQFGDGYEQRSSAGINNNLRSHSLKFDGLDNEIDAIEAFLEERGGVESFFYAHKNGIARLYVCEEWSRNDIDGASAELSATFREVVN